MWLEPANSISPDTLFIICPSERASDGGDKGHYHSFGAGPSTGINGLVMRALHTLLHELARNPKRGENHNGFGTLGLDSNVIVVTGHEALKELAVAGVNFPGAELYADTNKKWAQGV
jgi:hypothetical protein